ncbi:oxygenase MpaB family protein [Sphingomonas sp. LaA6.9]|uniref:oxygenase MpaB family protein n=1 Tax=Sphingomonas sp. LaA6.9 TaxID=2919914 RepID=UPI001F502E0A|nr:oxygenase MpaB family protein [Sphingomonas sp. LaA6.9]MCJ8158477.1 DUF2236 domain-containing protein [Sphingomonas sp. LaA6.9]
MSAGTFFNPVHALRGRIVGEVRAVFNDRAKGETPVKSSDDAIFPPGSVIRRVHSDVTTMMVGGTSALLLQMLHPAALAGVLEHSNFRDDMLGRLRRTARFIAITTYADHITAQAAIERVRAIHDRVSGTLGDGTPYHASDPHLLAWVHVAEATSFLKSRIAYAEPRMTRADQDRYFAESAEVALRLGADPVPRTRAEAAALIAAMRPELVASHECREVARLILAQRAPGAMQSSAQRLLALAAVDLLPGWVRTMLRLEAPAAPLLTRAATFGMAATLRWAFATRR